MLGRLVGRVDAGEVGESRPGGPCRRGPSGRAPRRRRAACRRTPRRTGPAPTSSRASSPLGAERRDERDEHDEAGVDHRARATSATRRMFSTRSASVKPRSLLSPWRTLSPSSRKVWTPRACSRCSTQVGDRRLAGTGQAGEPHDARPVALQRGAGLGRHVDRLPVDVLRAAQREVQQPGADGRVREAVDDDEAAHVAVVGVRVERDRADRWRSCRRRSR